MIEPIPKEFYERLARRRWRLFGGKIRTYAPRQCPVTAVANVPGIKVSCEAATRAGLTPVQAAEIMVAADNAPTRPDIRQRLLEACGLRENDD